MKIYVINMDRSHERLAAITSSFGTLGIPFERFSAIDGTKISDQEFASFQSTRPRTGKPGTPLKGRPWGRGQMGCFQSHFALWQKIASGPDQYAAIFEDDMHLSPALRHFLTSEAWIPSGADIIRLEPSTNRVLMAKEPVSTCHDRQLFKVLSTSWCAGGYIIRRSAALFLACTPHQYHSPVDAMMFSYEDSPAPELLNTLQVLPALCVQDKFFHTDSSKVAFKSDISAADESMTLKARLRYAMRRSPLTYLIKSLRGYRRICFYP